MQQSEHIIERSVSDKIDAIVTNKWLGYPIFLIVLYLIFTATFTLGGYPMNWIDWLVGKFGELVASLMSDG